GGAGYTAGELIRLLINHPEVEIKSIFSTSQAGKPVYSIHEDLVGETDLVFSDQLEANLDVVFLCLGHGNSKAFLQGNDLGGAKVIDLSNDFRLSKDVHFGKLKFLYGLPELNLEKIKKAEAIANPGCFATAIQLALLPLASGSHLQGDVHVNAITGSTGAGQSLSATTHFTWRNNNVSVYKAFNHQHLGEIGERIKSLQSDFDHSLHFIPMRGNFTRGILATAYTHTTLELDEIKALYLGYYGPSAFTHISDLPIHLKQVVNTNKCLLQLEKHGNQVLITSIIDNLLKGAAGQAVENMNLIFGLDQQAGLNLKANYH
ncbi:MAG: N-acetyl-gamma-glutamyl-phosphate reductase, partial [Bacteroidota bacterium]